MSDTHKILIVDDDKEIAIAISRLLSGEGYQTLVAHDGLQALDIIAQQEVHLVILDIMMPRLDGLSATMKIRADKNIPIIMLSAKSEDSDKVIGLSVGADDYMTKPFNFPELAARVRSQLRRYTQLEGVSMQPGRDHVLKTGGLTLNRETKQLHVDGEPTKVTATEYRILELLMQNLGRVFSSEEIYRRVWHEDAYAVENTVMVHIRRIREKIEINPKDPKYLKVVWGIGYKIDKI